MTKTKDLKTENKVKQVCCGNCYHSYKDSRTGDYRCFHPFWGCQSKVNPTKDSCKWGFERMR